MTAIRHEHSIEADLSREANVAWGLGSLPLEVRDPLGQNAKNADVFAISRIGSSTVYLTATGRNGANLHSTLHTGNNDAYTGPRITSEEVNYRREHGIL